MKNTKQEDCPLLKLTTSSDSQKATIKIGHTNQDFPTVSPFITAKFCEHLWSNIYNGMHAQILRNPTFMDYPFMGGRHPDGNLKFESDEEKIYEKIRGRAEKYGLPEADKMIEARADALANYWIKKGDRDRVCVSPDVGPHGGRAQRIEIMDAENGISQWVRLPLHRVTQFKWRIVLRSPDLRNLNLSMASDDNETILNCSEIKNISTKWSTFTGTLTLPEDIDTDQVFRLSLTSNKPGQIIVDRILLYPADHVGGADPDIIHHLKDAKLPMLRWPGGNFVSDYNWQDGIGPVDERPKRANKVWGNDEPNLFGSDEFMLFCREVGCEPLICVNAGNGTPEEAARWLEYMNGSAETPMGAKRAANGYPEPWNVKYWEIGNELTARHQQNWTTSAGYTDRHRLFTETLLAVDDKINLYANSLPVLCGKERIAHFYRPTPIKWDNENNWNWNKCLIENNADILSNITDHILYGSKLPASTDPLTVYHNFMALPILLGKKYIELEKQMKAAGISNPHLAITELQLFATIDTLQPGEKENLTQDNLVTPQSLAEGLSSILFYHLAIKSAPFIDIITHSATVNHGGGLKKVNEKVYTDACHEAQKLFSVFSKATPLPVELICHIERSDLVISKLNTSVEVPMIDLVAAKSVDGHLLISIINRSIKESIQTTIDLSSWREFPSAKISSLSADTPWSKNTLENPDKIKPVFSNIEIKNHQLVIILPAYSMTIIEI